MRFFPWRRWTRPSRRRTGPNGVRPHRLQVEALEDRTTVSTLYGLLPGNTLIRFDSASPGTVQAAVAITGLQSGAGESAVGIDFRPRTGQLFLTTVPAGIAANELLRTYTVN